MGLMEQVSLATPEEQAALTDDKLVEFYLKQERAKTEAKRRLSSANRPLELLAETDFDKLPPKQFIVPGLILESSLGFVVGEPGTLKTFLMLSLSLSIAAGMPTWLGRPLTRRGAVVYVLGEGAGRFKYRKDAWRQKHQITDDLPFYIMRRPVDLRDEKMMSEFLTLVSAHRPILIVFDTLNRNMPGAEENSAKEYGEAIAACERLQSETDAVVQLLHHPTKDGTSSRGSGAGKGAADSELWMKKTTSKYLFTLSVGKEKDADDDLELTLKKHVVELTGPDGQVLMENGEPITSCVVDLATQQDLVNAAAGLEQVILEFVQKNPNIKKGDVPRGIGKKRQEVMDKIEELIKNGCLAEAKGSGKSHNARFVSITQLGQNTLI
jgi:hypothetical protein